MIHDLEQVKAFAVSELHKQDFEYAVEMQKLKMALDHNFKTHKLVFQWPVKRVERHPVMNRRRTDKGRTV